MASEPCPECAWYSGHDPECAWSEREIASLRAALETAQRMAKARANIAERVIVQRDRARRVRDEYRAALETAERERDEARAIADASCPEHIVLPWIERGDYRKGADDG